MPGMLNTARLPLRIVSITSLLLAPVATAGESDNVDYDIRGRVGVESRLFLEDPLFPEQHEHYGSVMLRPEFSRTWNDGDERLVFTPFLRVSQFDDRRTHGDIRELYYEKFAPSWELRAGIRTLFWGVTESQHLVDIINQTDLVENIDTEDKLGQPMLEFAWVRDWGTLTGFLLPGFRERTFPGREGRLRGPLPVEVDEPEYDAELEQWHVDFALRYSHYVGDWDIGLSYFYGTSRDPVLELRPEAGELELIPVYDLIHQVGVDLQWTHEAWLLKFEGIAREGQDGTFSAITTGFEYTFFNVSGGNADVGVLAEWLFDSRGSSAPTSFENDVFVGMRLSLNDIKTTQLLAGAIIDPDSGATFGTLEASRRLGSSWRVSIEGRFFHNLPDDDPAAAIRRDDHLQVELSYYF